MAADKQYKVQDEDLIRSDISKYLERHEEKDLLRFLTCGSVDDGKSTLIGRLLYDSHMIYEDQLEKVAKDSKVYGTVGDDFDPALLTDGLKAEREQGITIDVAYRYFSTDKRTFIVADTPGHEQYTRNMATGATTCNLAVILIDARLGVITQTKRHSFIASLLGVPHMIVAINKMDLVDFSEEVYEKIRSDFSKFAARLSIPDIRFIPISALLGDNVVTRSSNMAWYKGEPLLEILENIYVGSDMNLVDLRFPVQYVLRPHLNFRGYCGQVASGVIRKGDEVMALPSGKATRVKSIVTYEGEIEQAYPPMSVAVTLEEELDVSRGEMLVHPHNVPNSGRHFEGMLVWMGEEPMDTNTAYGIKHTTRTAKVRIDEVRYKVDVNTLKRTDPGDLALNEIGRVVFTSMTPLFFDSYAKNRSTGSFVLIDPANNNTVAAGMIIEREPSDSLPSRITRGSEDTAPVRQHESQIQTAEREERMDQRAATIWLTGLTSSGKTSIAYATEKILFDLGATCVVLDGRNVRLGLSRGLDFGSDDRAEHLRRVAEVASLLNDSGIIVLCAFVSPSVSIRDQIKDLVGEDRFIEVHVDATAEWCEKRDETGLYEKARSGEVRNMAGVNAEYETPTSPALTLPVEAIGVDESAGRIVKVLRERRVFPISSG